MKKLLLLAAVASLTNLAHAQLGLNGSSYTQNFNGLSSTSNVLPSGWKVSVTSSTTALGTDVTGTKYDASGRTWTSFTNGFRNLASANGHTTFAPFGLDSMAQVNQADRALAVRQTGTVGDSTCAFMLNIANTTGLTNFALSFKLQSLDSTSPRVSTWRVDFGVGANPTSFTAATITSSTPLTTGGNTFSNNTITATFPAGINNQSGPVWIRIACLQPTTGSQNRPTTAIDDFNLTWTGNATSGIGSVAGRNELPVYIAGAARSNGFTLGYEVKKGGKYNLSVFDAAGRNVCNRELTVQQGAHQVMIDGLNLANGLYVVKLSNEESFGTVKTVVQ